MISIIDGRFGYAGLPSLYFPDPHISLFSISFRALVCSAGW